MSQPPLPFVAKHAFQGDARQNQLSFAAGTTILAKPGQTGAWWWGSANGKDGWFPPTYVGPPPPLAGPPPQVFAPPTHMLRQPGPVTFPAASPRPPQAAFGPPQAAFGSPPTQPAAVGFSTARPQPMYEPEDPFAGLDTTPTFDTAKSSVASFGSTASGSVHSSRPPPIDTSAATMAPVTTTLPPSTSVQPTSSKSSTPTKPPLTSSMTSKSLQPDPTAAAMARLGISPSVSKASTPAGSRATSPTMASRGSSPAPPTAAFSGATDLSKQNQSTVASAAPSNPLPPKQESPEERQARVAREAEEARIKAQLRKEKEEIRLMQERQTTASAAGLGTSGVNISTVDSGGGLQHGMAVVFNPYDFLMGTTGVLPERKFSPIFRTPPFWALLNLNNYILQKPVPAEKLKDRSAMYAQLSKALSFVSYVCQQIDASVKSGKGRRGGSGGINPLKFLEGNHYACEACIKLISLLPHSAGASGQQLDGLFLNFLNVYLSMLEHVQPNQQLVLPGGWQQPEYAYLCLYILRNNGGNRWSFTVCNTGQDGIQYHPATFDPETGKELKQMAMTIWDIPASRILDSTFWVLLFRMQVYPSRKNNAAFLYTKLLPSLNSRPLLSNLDQGPAEYLEVPNPISAQSYHPLTRLALTTTPQTGCRSSKYSTLILMNAATDLAYNEIENLGPSAMDPEDSRILKLVGRNLANYASTISPDTVGDGTIGATLSDTWDLLDRLLKKINFSSSKPMDQHSHGLSAAAMNDDFAQGKIVSMKTNAGSAAHPLFGRLRRDNYGEVVKNLMGDPRQDPILIPPVLTDEELPPLAKDYSTASSYMQRVADACSLLLQQRRLIRNAPAFAASAAQHALMTMLPFPNSNPQFCFWRKFPMRRETQLNLLFLIRRLCRIYSAATACVQESRGLIAIRSTALACGACVADAICRAVAVDDPSTFALHYSGLCEGPTEPFGIEAGAYDTLGSNLPIYDPAICSLRFQCLEYMRELTYARDGSKKKTIFNFDKSLSPMSDDLVLIDQLSIQLALQRPFPRTEEAMMNRATNLISGRNGSIIEVLPEFEYFRDIVFHFKHAVSGKAAFAEVPDSHTWLPSDATLHWDCRRREKEDPILVYHVTAFQGHLQDFVPRVAQQEEKSKQSETSFLGFKALFAAKTRIERSRLSSADPTTVVNSCGEKFLNKKYVLSFLMDNLSSLQC